jgi:ABC transporter, substrate-binding protein, aliphatic sulfonates family
MLAGILLLTVGCSSKKKENLTVRIAYFSNITHSQALVMKQKKSLEQKLGDTCQVVWYNFNAGPQEVEAMFADEIDLGYIGPVPAINANVKSNGDIRIIANACDAGAVLIKSRDAAIHTIADLDKKTVAVPQLGNTQHLCLLNLLTENGLAAKSDGGSVDVVAVNNADMPGMLEQGKIDAALVPEPWGSIMEEQCDAQLVLDYNKIFLNGNYPSTVIIVNNDFYKQHKDIVRVFLETHNEITTYINNHKDEAFEIINHQIEQATGVKYDSKIINKAYQRLSITDKISEKAIKKLGEIGVEQGFISKLPSDSIIYTSILDDLK